MSLKPVIYESLTPPQRVVATLDALGRGDDEEVQRLRETCPFKTYRQRDAAFSDTMNSLMMMSLAIESELTACALSFLATASSSEKQIDHLQEMANIQGGWLAVLNDLGISAEPMLRAGPPRHGIVAQLLTMAPEFEADAAKDFMEAFKEYLRT